MYVFSIEDAYCIMHVLRMYNVCIEDVKRMY